MGVVETMLSLLGITGVWVVVAGEGCGRQAPYSKQLAALPGSEHYTMGIQVGPHPGNRLEEGLGQVGDPAPPQKTCQAGLPGEGIHRGVRAEVPH